MGAHIVMALWNKHNLATMPPVARPAFSKGKGCNGALSMVTPCVSDAAKADCVWGPWSSWGTCSKCGEHGQMRRSRRIAILPYCSGAMCSPHSSVQTATCMQVCQRRDNEASLNKFCVWDDWLPFGPCSVSCGQGIQSRSRHLLATSVDPFVRSRRMQAEIADLETMFSQFHVHSRALESS